jgi:hypothetical protein
MGTKNLISELLKNGYIRFGRAAVGHYDPVCLAIKSRKNRDYKIVRIDHEEVLCSLRIKVMYELAPSFRVLVLKTIERAETARKARN